MGTPRQSIAIQASDLAGVLNGKGAKRRSDVHTEHRASDLCSVLAAECVENTLATALHRNLLGPI